jgi:hypothetical protein
VGLTGSGLTLGAVFRLLHHQGGFSSSIPSLLVLICFPGLLVWMIGAGTLGFACWAFIRGLRSLQTEALAANVLRGGLWMGISVLFHPAFLLPALFTIPGTFESNRKCWIPYAGALLGSLLVVGGIWFGVSSDVQVDRVQLEAQLQSRFWIRTFSLWGALGLMLGYGVFRRGVGWWSLMGALGLPLWGLLQGESSPSSWIPLLVLVSIGLAKLPVLLDLRHPRAYLSVLVFQLFLWIPSYLPLEEDPDLPPPPNLENPSDDP